jgi:hypothetical protein
MKNTPTLLLLLTLLPFFLPPALRAQSATDWSKPEERLADLLLRDSVTRTVSYLPKGYWFGLDDRSHGSLVLVKDGPRNYMLRDGTHQVFLLEQNNGKKRLQRLDSSVFSGDNFLMMAFLRNDTIYQYGGYGFWNTRDFFMRYRAANRDWDFLTGGAGLPNELNYHYYDPKRDAFYVIGSLSSTHHPYPRKVLVDSVYQYDFRSRRWTSLGRIRSDFSDLDSRRNDMMSFCFTSFGFLDCRTFGIKLYDIPNNRILDPKDPLTDLLFDIGRTDRLFEERYRLFILLNDTVHLLQGRPDSVRHTTFRVTLEDFNASMPQRIFTPVSSGTTLPLSGTLRLILFVFLPLAGGAGTLLYRKRMRMRGSEASTPMQDEKGTAEIMPETIPDPIPDPIPDESPISMPASTHTSDDVSDDDDLRFFQAQLNPSEMALLDLLLRETLAGHAADIHAINKILGVSSKEASLQKARRSLSINHINSCFRQTFKMDATLIIRERDLVDKRAFVYKLDPRYAESIGRNRSST